VLSRSELKSLQTHRDYPSVSILAPTHRTAPSNKQDPIKVKNLVRKAIARLHDEFIKREVAAVASNLQRLVRDVDWGRLLDGLALLASKERAAAVSLPFRVKPRAVIDETFATRDLAYAFNRAPPYRVLVLSHRSRLYDAWTTVLDEHTVRPFPMVHRGPGLSKRPGAYGINPSAKRDEANRAFFRSVDDAVAALQKVNPLPLVVVGVERNLAFFQEVTRQAGSIIGMKGRQSRPNLPERAGQAGVAGLRVRGDAPPDGGPRATRPGGQRPPPCLRDRPGLARGRCREVPDVAGREAVQVPGRR